jgi:hypothetical protein
MGLYRDSKSQVSQGRVTKCGQMLEVGFFFPSSFPASILTQKDSDTPEVALAASENHRLRSNASVFWRFCQHRQPVLLGNAGQQQQLRESSWRDHSRQSGQTSLWAHIQHLWGTLGNFAAHWDGDSSPGSWPFLSSKPLGICSHPWHCIVTGWSPGNPMPHPPHVVPWPTVSSLTLWL